MLDHTLPDPTQATPRDAGSAAPALVVIEDESTWRFPLPPAGAVTIGRIAECEVVLRDPSASRKHAQLRVDDGRVFVADLGSYNGTTVNGDPLTGERELRTGDVVQVCATMLVFHGGERKADGASMIARMLFEEATDINFFVGRAVNPAHQNPDLPINFSIKMNLVKELSECLRKMGKRIKVSYF